MVMRDEEVREALRQLLLSEEAPPISDAAADAILEAGGQCSEESFVKSKDKFFRKVYREKFPEPVREVDQHFTMADFLESIRTQENLDRRTLSVLIDERETDIEILESGRPWESSPTLVTKIMEFFHIHIDAMKQLVAASAAVNQSSGLGQVSARARSGKMDASRGHSTSRSLERFMALNSKRSDLPEQAANWLSEIEKGLTRSGLDGLK
jgi:hypothetical protein